MPTSTGIVIEDGKAWLTEVRGTLKKNRKKQGHPLPQEEFAERIGQRFQPPKDLFPIPRNVRLIEWIRETSGILVVELEPATRTFQWIKDINKGRKRAQTRRPADFGEKASYEQRSLALPYIVLVLPFAERVLQNSICQVFYRTEPLKSWDDSLLMTNLLNVAQGYGFTSWLCMAGYNQKQGLSWQEAVEQAVRYFLWSAFNRSSEVHERNSHYGTIRDMKLDQRISSAEKWEMTSRTYPEFMCGIPWPKTGHTLRSAVDLSRSKMRQPKLSLVNLVQAL